GVGTVLPREARGADITARLGGEEFVAVLPHGDVTIGAAFAERVRAAVADSFTLSAGVAAAQAPVHPDAVLGAADKALYAAKRAGRDRTVIAPPTVAPPLESTLEQVP